MNASLVTAPVLEPISVLEAKEHLRVITNDEDEYISTLITAAREEVEDITRRVIMTQTWDYFLDEFPDEDYITLPFGKLASVTTVKWKDEDAAETTLTVTTDYLVETNGDGYGRIVLPVDVYWPSDELYVSNPISIRFVAGWTTRALVPSRIKSAIKMLVSDMYESRGEDVIGTAQTVIKSLTADRLLASLRLW